MRALLQPAPILAAAVTAAVVAVPLVVPLSAQASGAPEISEISYAGGDDSDFIEIKADPGTDLSGWTVGTVTRGGTPQSANHVVTLEDGTEVGDSGAHAVYVPITNSVNSGAAADGSYGSSAFAVDADGELVDFDQVGGVVGGKGVTAGSGTLLPDAVQGEDAVPTGAVSARGESIQLVDGEWVSAAPTPGELPGAESEEPDPDPVEPEDILTIAQIQGTGDTSPYVGETVSTTGVVTAVYTDGGLNGYVIQTGGAEHTLGGASNGLFVYSPQTVGAVETGDSVIVTGRISEYYGQTQISVSAGGLLDGEEQGEPVVHEGEFPEDEAERESLESMLILPTGEITVTDNYSTHTYGEVSLVNGTEPLFQATDVVSPGTEAQEYEAANAAREFVLDDGASANYTQAASDVPVPYVSTEDPLRVGAQASFTDPVVVSYGFDAWRLQPTGWLTGENADELQPVEFADTREASPQEVGGDLTVSSFNVLNYFSTTGDQLEGCTYYTDRAGDPTTVSGGCDARGAANQENFERQQSKIVDAISALDASVLSLEEIETSSAFGKDRDDALANLVDALNADAGAEVWDLAASPEALPEAEDVIRTAFIYQPAEVVPVGDSVILTDSGAFSNAREPLAQAWAPAAEPASADGDQDFLTIVNHFKSKGSGSGEGNVDNGDGQGSSNADRVRQAEALVEFAEAQAARAGTDDVVLLGDFNSYTQEDPMQVFYEAGYANVGAELTDEQTYLFGGRVGSLDHVLVSEPLFEDVSGADVWNINSVESIGLEYSRFNANVTNLHSDGPFRSSDHDPLLVGLTRSGEDGEPTEEPTDEPTGQPTEEPTDEPTDEPTGQPTEEPTGQPSEGPTEDPGDRDDNGAEDDSKDNGTDDDARDRDGGRDGQLPRTGASLGVLGAAAALLGAGLTALLVARRRMG